MNNNYQSQNIACIVLYYLIIPSIMKIISSEDKVIE